MNPEGLDDEAGHDDSQEEQERDRVIRVLSGSPL